MNKEYSRRDFLRKNSIAGFGMIGAVSFGGTLLSTDALAKDNENAVEINKISELNLKKLRDTYMEALLGKFIPNMDTYVVDH